MGWLRWAVGIVVAFVGATLVEEAGGSVLEFFRRGSPALTADQRRRQRIGGALVAVVGAGVGLVVLLAAYWLLR